METEIVDFDRTTGPFKGIVDGHLADRSAPRPHKQKLAVAVRLKPVERLARRFVDGDGLSPQGLTLNDRDRPALKVHIFPFEL